jgi:hypothetical protein
MHFTPPTTFHSHRQFNGTGRLRRLLLALLVAAGLVCGAKTQAQVLLTEIMYHPVEEPAFNADGSPMVDLHEDVHEFIELHNAGSTLVSLEKWTLSGGIWYEFPANSVLPAGGYMVVAKDPGRLSAVLAYNLAGVTLLGPYEGQLSNRGDTIRVRDAAGQTVDAVSYSGEFPWAISADSLGADEEWTGLKALDYQYRGRSLERVSFSWPANDPANWLASPLPGNPSPGRPNAVHRAVPQPVVVQFSAVRAIDEARLIRSNQPVRIQAQFSSAQDLANVRVEWFVDDLDVRDERKQTVAMSPDGPANAARFTVILPGQPDRSVVRYRFLGDRGSGDEVISPRRDDPYGGHAYFVTPTRTSPRPIYDCFISSNSLSLLRANITQNPRRVTSPDPPGMPRTAWNDTQPAVMVHDGVVYDIRMRHHGSRYNRSPDRNSFKWQFPRYRKFNGVTGIFETDKGNDFIVGHGLFRAAGLPVSAVRYVDLFLNDRAAMQRLEQGEFDGDMLDEYHHNQQALNPGSPLEPSGEIYKVVGTIDMNGEGPYGRGDGRKLSKPPYWTDLQMYDWTFSLQNHGWRGSYSWKQMIDAFWVARGDTPAKLNPNVPALRVFFTDHFDVDAMLTYIALENWCCPWDDTTQNHFLWQRSNGKWGMLPWDNDAWYGRGDNTPATASIFMGEAGDPNNNYRGPNFFKDAFIKAFRPELKERFFLLNNTFLHPDNLSALGFGSIRAFAQARMTSVNQQCALGVFQRPDKPVSISPVGGATALPPTLLSASAYQHSATPSRPHALTTWEIRAASGSYATPVWKLRSTTNLTSVTIPFELLRFGETYFWRCTYEDADRHPSVSSDEASFNFGPTSAQVTIVPIDATSLWRYDQSGTDWSTQDWTASAFDDSHWPSGAAILAKEEAALPEPIRTPLTLGRTTYYFRKHFDFPGPSEGATVQMQYVIDDGCVIYLNGKELMRLRMPTGPVSSSTFASQNVGDAVSEGPFDVPASFLQPGDNVVAVEVHQSNTSSSDVVFGLSIQATLPAASGLVLLNEIAARNADSVPHGSGTPDWIELYNNSSQTIDLGGFSLSDDVLKPGKFLFPTGTLMAARGSLVVWCDDATDTPGLHSGFKLNDQGQTVALYGPESPNPTVRDYVTFGLQAADLTIGRAPDGSGDWQLTVPTPGAPNQVCTLAPSSSLKINEWMASPTSGNDWLELYNPSKLPVALDGLYLTDDSVNPTNTRLPSLSFVAAGDFLKLVADQNLASGADHLGFKLSAGGESVALYAANSVTLIDSIHFGPQTSGVSQGRLPDGADTLAFFPETASPGEPNHVPLRSVVISEVLAHTDPPLEDAIELQNISPSPVDLSGWWLSDSLRHPRKYQIPASTILGPGQFAVFYENQVNRDSNSPSSFALSSAHGDELVLSAADTAGNLNGSRTKVDFGATERGISIGRFPTSQGHDFTALARRTFGIEDPVSVEQFRLGLGQSNSTAKVGPVVISEIMFHPPNLGTNDNTRDEFVELFNPGDQPVPLFEPDAPANTWQLRGGVDFQFPPAVTIPARGALVVVGFDPSSNLVARTEFQAVYGAVAALYGPFRSKLGNADDAVRLYRPDAPEAAPGPEAGFVPYIQVDAVEYSALPPWPNGASGTGASIARLDHRAYGNEPLNWKAMPPSPGRVDEVSRGWQLAITRRESGTIVLSATGPVLGTLALQASTDLESWNTILSRSAADGALEYEDPQPASAAARYYRIVLPVW